MTVYIAAMNMRGIRAHPLDKDTIKINVTSAQAKNNANRLAFSPMTEVKGGYKDYWCFENYWQSGKVYRDIPREKTRKWWRSLREPRRRYPGSKGKTVLYAQFEDEDEKDTRLDYVSSRKQVYVPEYYRLIRKRDQLKYWQEQYQEGQSLTIYDFDGHRDKDGTPICLEVSLDLLREKIEDETFPFGHGYVVAASIMGIKPKQYC